MDRVGPFDPSTLTVPYGSLAAWENAAPASGVAGSVPSIEAWIHAIEEIVYTIEQSGQTPDHTNLHQLAQATKTQTTKGAGRLLAVQTFSASGVYTPTLGMQFCVVEGVGGGGAGAGAGNASGAGYVSLGAPGTSGTYGRAFFTAAQIGASQSVAIGAAGLSQSGGNGGNGGTTSLGSLIVLPGGVGGQTLTQQVAPTVNGNGTTSGAATGTPGANILSQPGSVGSITTAISSGIGQGGPGGFNPLGTGGYGSSVNGPGASGTGFGSGGAGCFVNASGGSIMGGAGRPGGVIITEYGVAP